MHQIHLLAGEISLNARINVNVESTSDSVIDLLANPGSTAYSSLFCLTLLRLVDIRRFEGNVLVVLSV